MPYKLFVEYCIQYIRIHLEYPIEYQKNRIYDTPGIPCINSKKIRVHILKIRKSRRSENSSIKVYLIEKEILRKKLSEMWENSL